MKPMLLTDYITFGKYKGQYFTDILKNDPSYLVWLHTTKPEYLTGEVLTALDIWVLDNMAEARKVAERAKRAMKKEKAHSSHTYSKASVSSPSPMMPVEPASKPACWGSW